MGSEEAFFIPVGERLNHGSSRSAAATNAFQATELTRGPWDPDSQHAGPPTALIGREIELLVASAGDDQASAVAGGKSRRDESAEPLATRSGWQVGRITFEILCPVPIDVLSLEARIVRPGKRVQHVEAVLRGLAGDLIRARAWVVRRAEIELPANVSSRDIESPARRAGRPTGALGPPPGPPRAADSDFFPVLNDVGYQTAIEYRFAEGSFLELGPATTWMRMLHPLVAGEEPTPLQRVLIAADSGNGVSATLDFRHYLFVNVDLSVHLHRMPIGEWVCLDSISVPEPAGMGISDSALYDEQGPIGRALQTLLIAERDE